MAAVEVSLLFYFWFYVLTVVMERLRDPWGQALLFPTHLDGCWRVLHTCLVNKYKFSHMELHSLHNEKYCKPEYVSLWLSFPLTGKLIFLYTDQTFGSSLGSRKKWLSWVLPATLCFPSVPQCFWARTFVETAKIFKEPWTPLQEPQRWAASTEFPFHQRGAICSVELFLDCCCILSISLSPLFFKEKE